MEKKYTNEEIKKAMEQALANMNFEKINNPKKEKNNAKVFRKDNLYGNRRSD